MTSRAQHMAILGLVTVFALLGATWYWVASHATKTHRYFPLSSTDVLLSPVRTTLPTGESVELELHAFVLTNMIPVEAYIRTENLEPENVNITLYGVHRNLGNWTPVVYAMDAQTFRAQTVLPSYDTKEIRWHADVWIQTPKGVLVAPFEFTVHRSFHQDHEIRQEPFIH